MISTVSRGYAIEFVSRPPSGTGTRITPTPRDSARRRALCQEISSLLIKEVVEPVPYHLRGTGFYCNLFLVPKKSGGFRPVLNLKPLNPYVQRKGFKLDSIRSVKNTLQRGDFATSLDLQDAYLHIPI